MMIEKWCTRVMAMMRDADECDNAMRSIMRFDRDWCTWIMIVVMAQHWCASMNTLSPRAHTFSVKVLTAGWSKCTYFSIMSAFSLARAHTPSLSLALLQTLVAPLSLLLSDKLWCTLTFSLKVLMDTWSGCMCSWGDSFVFWCSAGFGDHSSLL